MIGKLEYYVNRAIPYAWDDSESWYEFLAKVITKVNELVDMSNDYFDKDLSEYVEQILNAWYESGKLSDIILSALDDAQSKIDAKATKHWVDVTDFGAIGDGVNDDTAAVLESVSTIGNGGVLYFPNKEYIINAEINLPSNTTVIGEKSRIKSSLNPDVYLFKISGKENVNLENINVSLINSGRAIGVENSDNIVIKAVEIIGGLTGIDIGYTNRLIVEKCYLDDMWGNHGIAILHSTNINIVNNVIKNTKRSAVSINRGSKNINVDNNICDFNQQDFKDDGAIDIYGNVPECENVKITNNIITNSGIAGNNNCGIRIKDAINVTVEDNFIRVDNHLFAPIYLQGRDEENNSVMKDISIVNNRIIINNKVDYVFRTTKAWDPPMTNILFEGNYIESERSDVGGFEIRHHVENFQIKNNKIRLTNRSGEMVHLHVANNQYPRKNVIISGNDVNYLSGAFVYSIGCDGLIVSNNMVNTESTVGLINIPGSNNNIMVLNNYLKANTSSLVIDENINQVIDNNMVIVQ